MKGSSTERGYGGRWRRLRLRKLAMDPLCRMCAEMGRTTVANVVDHIVAHKGDHTRLYDLDNLQSLCETCHNAVKQAEERGGVIRGAGTDGVPIDPGHHWR